MGDVKAGVIEWSSSSVPLAGETECGDLSVVVAFPGGALAAVIDGLGHGGEAARAAKAAARVLESYPHEALPDLVQRCHAALRQTRGAVMLVATFDVAESSLAWLGVGNIAGALQRRNLALHPSMVALSSSPGIVGHQLPRLHSSTMELHYGDAFIAMTDGIDPSFDRLPVAVPPAELVDSLLERAHGRDDACALAVRHVGGVPAAHVVPMLHDSDVAVARLRARDLGRAAGLTETATERLATAVTELARNILVHAGLGEVRIACVSEGTRSGVIVVAHDHGPGIYDVERALRDGASTGDGLGLGLSSARRLVDDFALDSEPGVGTSVTLWQWSRP